MSASSRRRVSALALLLLLAHAGCSPRPPSAANEDEKLFFVAPLAWPVAVQTASLIALLLAAAALSLSIQYYQQGIEIALPDSAPLRLPWRSAAAVDAERLSSSESCHQRFEDLELQSPKGDYLPLAHVRTSASACSPKRATLGLVCQEMARDFLVAWQRHGSSVPAPRLRCQLKQELELDASRCSPKVRAEWQRPGARGDDWRPLLPPRGSSSLPTR